MRMTTRQTFLITLILGLAGGFVLAGILRSSDTASLGTITEPLEWQDHSESAPPIEVPASVVELERAFEQVAEVIRPSIVMITTRRTVEVRRPGGSVPPLPSPFEDFFQDDLFDRFFDRAPAPRRPDQDAPAPRDEGRSYEQHGLGSGFIVDSAGHILTNHHVIQGVDEILVQLADGREYTAEVVGSDDRTDVAVIRIEADGLVSARLGDSSRLRPGRWVIAAGSPFGLDHTFTAGIVSATGRAGLGITGIEGYEDFIQTDAAINRGNSGGPLVTLNGEVVGMNTAIITRTGGAMGVGLAIPINMARFVMQSLIEHGEVVRGYIGVEIRDLTEGMARSFNYDSIDGVLVENVLPGTPAYEAGLQPGDIIVRYNDEQVTDVHPFRNRVSQMPPGTRLSLDVWRENRIVQVELVVARLDVDARTAQRPERPARSELERLGLTVQTIDAAARRQFGIDDGIDGAVIIDVRAASPAARAGLRPGMVIRQVQDQRVRSAEEFRTAVDEADLADGIRLRVHTGQREQFVFIQVR